MNKTRSQKIMTTTKNIENREMCPVEALMKTLSGKWKMQIFRLAIDAPVRFNSLLRQLEEANRQSLAVALKEMEKDGLITKNVINEKPLHIEYVLSEKGKLLLPIFFQLEQFQSSM